MAFHAINNGLAVLFGELASRPIGTQIAPWLFRNRTAGHYHGSWIMLGILVSIALLADLLRRPAADPVPGRVDPSPASALRGSLDAG